MPPPTGMIAWYKADAGLYTDVSGTVPATSDGDLIQVWKDQSGNNWDTLQPNSAKRPALKLSILNSQPVIRFTSADGDFLQTSVTVTHGIGTGDFWLAVVYIEGSSFSIDNTLFSNGTFAPGFYAPGDSGAHPGVDLSGLPGGALNFTDTVATSTAYLSEFVRSTGTWKLYHAVVGSTPAEDATTLSNATSIADARFSIGGDNGGDFFNGDIAEILIYPTALNSTDQSTLETYLNGRYSASTPSCTATPSALLTFVGTNTTWTSGSTVSITDEIGTISMTAGTWTCISGTAATLEVSGTGTGTFTVTIEGTSETTVSPTITVAAGSVSSPTGSCLRMGFV